MSLSVKLRLTLTSVFLTALVLFPAGFAVHEFAERLIESESSRQALEAARRAAEDILKQWDEEFLVEFADDSVVWSLKTDVQNCAVVRPNGRVEWATGAFARGVKPEATETSRLLESDVDGQPALRVASTPILHRARITLDDFPGVAKGLQGRMSPSARFLSLRRELSGSSPILEVKFLDGTGITELQLSADGALLGVRAEKLPKALPRDLVALLTEGGKRSPPELLRWTAHEGQLLAIVKATDASGLSGEIAVNRVGERFYLQGEKDVASSDAASRLFATVGLDASSEGSSMRAVHAALWVGGSVAWCLLALVSWFVTRRAMAPVRDIVNAVQRIGVSRLSERLPVPRGKDELSQIADTINGMLERVQAGYRREHQFTGDASHELRTPLAKVIAEIGLALSRERSGDEYRESLERCRGYAARMQRQVEALLLLARLEEEACKATMESVDLGTLAAETIGAFPPSERDRIQLRLEQTEAPLEVAGERSLLGILLRNLIENSLRYSTPPAPVLVEISRRGDEVIAKIVDEGRGIPVELRERVFDPFFRLDAVRSKETGGFGLGLSIVRAIARVHGTQVELKAGAGKGTIAILKLAIAR